MAVLKMFEDDKKVVWDYDKEADVLYLSLGEPKKAEGIDIGNGTIIRVSPENNEIVGITIINPLKRTLDQIK
jgi:uncharacterized protein YuzE